MESYPQVGGEDEALAFRRYSSLGWQVPLAGIPLPLIAYFLDSKWVVAYGLFILVGSALVIDARVTDLVIRLKLIDQKLRGQNSD